MARWPVALFASSIAILFAATIATTRSGDPALYPPPPSAPTVDIYVISHGYHSGIALPHEAMREAANTQGLSALMAVSTRFPGYSFIEFGWGEERFYRNVRTSADVTWPLAARALLNPDNASVMHVVGLALAPERLFTSSDIVRLSLSEEGFARLLSHIDAAFKPQPSGPPLDELGPGLYGPSRFYRAEGAFHLLKLCNHWVIEALSAAGVPTSPLLATHPIGLLWDLRWRAGAVAVSAQRPT